MDYTVDTITQVISMFNISKAFGIGINDFLTIILGSFIVGYICLTFHYKIYSNNQRWTELDYFEKAIVSLVIGFFSILISIYVVMIYQLTFPKDNIDRLGQFFLQLNYITPFLYFIAFSTIAAKYDYKELDLIKKYISVSFFLFVNLNFAFALIIFYLIRSWSGFLLFLIIVIAFNYRQLKDYLPSLSARIKMRS
ncbi:MAG: hypothetical protein OIN85_01735 [Candidatus Methanoperedens sp.]|nr:hypothetical protein [Candidatus Methanoperedens sp.]